jgi:hypothetical protein
MLLGLRWRLSTTLLAYLVMISLIDPQEILFDPLFQLSIFTVDSGTFLELLVAFLIYLVLKLTLVLLLLYLL